MPRIVFKKNELPPVDLNQTVIFGRSEKHSNIVVQDNRLSRAHCRMEAQADDTWMVTDLDSQNGTFVNGRRIKECMIKAGDVIRIGAVDMLFEATGPGGATVMAGVQSGRMAPASEAGELDLADDSVAKPTINTIEGTRTMIAPAALVLLKGTLKDKIHPLVADVFTIGRKHDNHLCLEGDGKASGHHAHIRKDGDTYIVEDLGSTNGITVNGEKVDKPVVLKTGSKLVVGQQVFRFQLQGKEAESSGETAPQLAHEDVQLEAKLAELDKVGESEPTMMDASGGGDTASAQEDMSALTQEISYKGGSAGLFAAIEIIVAVLVVAGIIFAVWTFKQGDALTAGPDDETFSDARDGDLLTLNSSFDDGKEARLLTNWAVSLSGTDSVAVVEGGHGGQFALQISRFSPSNRITEAGSEMIEASGQEGITVSAFMMNGEAAQQRFGTGIVSIWWYRHKADREPMLITPVATATKLSEWTDISGSCKRPTGANAFRVFLGLTGQKGSMLFDDIQVSQNNSAAAMFTSNELTKDGVTWNIDSNGNITLSDTTGKLLQRGVVNLYHGDGIADPLDPLAVLSGQPSSDLTDDSLIVKYPYFDALAEKPAQMVVVLEIKDGKAEFSASIREVDNKGLGGVGRRIGFSCFLTNQFAPDKLVRIEDKDVLEFANEIGADSGKEFKSLTAANTGTGNTISVVQLGPSLSIAMSGGGRLARLMNRGSLSFDIGIGQGREDVAERAALCSMVQEGESQVDRVNRAISIFKDYPYCQPELQLAANAIDSAAKHYKLRLIELRDGINVPRLTRNELLYRAAMEESILNADTLSKARNGWETGGRAAFAAVGLPNMSAICQQAAEKAKDAITELIAVAKEFEELETGARRALFLLVVEVEQRESEPYAVSARDFYDSGQIVQAMVKFRTIVKNYPRCARGIGAKESSVDAAEDFLDEMDMYSGKGLKNIAMDRAIVARSLLDTVDRHLLTRILTPEELVWLRKINTGDGATKDMVSREDDLADRMNQLRKRLPANMPKKETESEGND